MTYEPVKHLLAVPIESLPLVQRLPLCIRGYSLICFPDFLREESHRVKHIINIFDKIDELKLLNYMYFPKNFHRFH